jgi:hypothetical protein
MKKTTVVVLLSLLSAGPALANTFWDFSFTGSNGADTLSAIGTLEVTSGGLIVNITGTLTGATAGNGTISAILPAAPNVSSWNGNTNAFYFPPGFGLGGANLDTGGVSFLVNGDQYWNFENVSSNSPATYQFNYGGTAGLGVVTTYGASPVTFVEALPEINATALPRAVLLLGSMYLLATHRKKREQ